MARVDIHRWYIRGICATAIALASMAIYCGIISAETVPFAAIVGGFILPSVGLLLLLERLSRSGIGKYLGFFFPVVVIVAVCAWALYSSRRGGDSDGASQLVTYFLECYALGLISALAWLSWSRKR